LKSRPAVPAAAVLRAADRREAESVSLWFRLLSCHAILLGELRRELEDRITLARFDLLSSLEREDGQTLAGLSRALLVTAGNVTGLVDRAERDDVVERRPDPADRRVARVWLTTKGRALIRELLPLHARHVDELIGSFAPSDRRELRRLLGGLRDHLRTKGGRSSSSSGPSRRARTRS
jgi:DNA-binding MarR family transcriptional regulator